MKSEGWERHLVIEVALEVAAAAAEAEHGANFRQQLLQSRQEVLVKPHYVRVAQLLPVQATSLLSFKSEHGAVASCPGINPTFASACCKATSSLSSGYFCMQHPVLFGVESCNAR